MGYGELQRIQLNTESGEVDSDGKPKMRTVYPGYIEENGKKVYITKFENEQQMHDAMAQPEYQTDESFRRVVHALAANSDFVKSQSVNRVEIGGPDRAKAAQDAKAQRYKMALAEWMQEQQSDPRYKTSEMFRLNFEKQLAEYMKQNPEVEGMVHQPTQDMEPHRVTINTIQQGVSYEGDSRGARIRDTGDPEVDRPVELGNKLTIDVEKL